MAKRNPDNASTADKRKTERQMRIYFIAFFVLVGVLAVATFAFFELAPQTHQPAEATSLQTWQQWGMSIQYPSGLQAEYFGLNGQQADSANGGVIWSWNSNRTLLGLQWFTVSSYNISAAFQGVYNSEQEGNVWNDITVTDQGNVSLDGSTWQYQTSHALAGGEILYTTMAYIYYPSIQRAYGIIFSDSSPDTLSALEYYGNTFSG